MEKVIVIVGPTGVGKTSLSINLANDIPIEIISGDSMQLYKGMDIGTGKITPSEKKGIPHYMLDIKEADESFSVAEFQKMVQYYISHIHSKQKIPVIVGGTGLYIQAVLYDYQFQDRKRDEGLTKKLEDRIQKEGNKALYEELLSIDRNYALTIHPNNKKRLIRALEVYETTGLTMSEFHKKQQNQPKYDHYLIGLEMNRRLLYDRINERVDYMIQQGLVDEVRSLFEKGYEQAQAMRAIGYKEFIPYLKEETSFENATNVLKRNSRRYAKRQYTWFKNRMDIHWYQLNKDNRNEVYDKIKMDSRKFLNI